MAEPKRHMDVPKERVSEKDAFHSRTAPNVGCHQVLHWK